MVTTVKAKISDLDAAIRSLELSTNPTLQTRQPCNCQATRHPLLAAAPNCLNCGKVICVQEGLGPCTFCGHPLLSADDTQSMIRTLREERGRERQEANNASHRRAEVSTKTSARAFLSSSSSTPPTRSLNPSPSRAPSSLSAAEQHRDKLLGFQDTSARRTRIIDEAADFETPNAGLSMWATPQERALQLKQQQKTLREQEWNSKQDYEKRRMVVAIDLKGKKVTREMVDVDRPVEEEGVESSSYLDVDGDDGVDETVMNNEGGTFSRNPLLGGLIRPTYPTNKEKGVEENNEDGEKKKKQNWRRVQDDYDDNEQLILDGGVYGRRQDQEDQASICG
ncbi:MAG: hypothetical protein M1823_000656 [Watsoniomyces obsoletus]|nr:MAG: hypothetical protein M1823_000656 [Watsoniomyces obsoletus]